jgi:hypothetical protein
LPGTVRPGSITTIAEMEYVVSGLAQCVTGQAGTATVDIASSNLAYRSQADVAQVAKPLPSKQISNYTSQPDDGVGDENRVKTPDQRFATGRPRIVIGTDLDLRKLLTMVGRRAVTPRLSALATSRTIDFRIPSSGLDRLTASSSRPAVVTAHPTSPWLTQLDRNLLMASATPTAVSGSSSATATASSPPPSTPSSPPSTSGSSRHQCGHRGRTQSPSVWMPGTVSCR